MAGLTKDTLLERLRGGAPLRFGHQVRLTATLSYPAIIAQFSTVAMQLIDTAMVGHLSTDAGAAIGLVATCMWLLGGFCFACCNGFSVQVAHLVGAGDFKGARSVVRQALSSALIWCLGFTLLALAIARPLPLWLGGSGEVAAQASRYFLVTALFLPFLQFDFLAATILQASGEMRVPSLLNVLMCVLDVALNYLFIWVLDLGVVGAALGTGLAELMIATSMVWYLTCRCKDLKLRGEKGSFAPTRPVVNNALRIGLPLCLENIVMRGAYVAGTVIVAPLGAVAVAANNFAVTAESFCYMPADPDRHPAVYLRAGGHGADQQRPRGRVPRRHRPPHRGLRRDDVCRLHRVLRRLRRCRRHAPPEHPQFQFHLGVPHRPRHLALSPLRSRRLLDRDVLRTQYARRPLPLLPSPRPLASPEIYC